MWAQTSLELSRTRLASSSPLLCVTREMNEAAPSSRGKLDAKFPDLLLFPSCSAPARTRPDPPETLLDAMGCFGKMFAKSS